MTDDGSGKLLQQLLFLDVINCDVLCPLLDDSGELRGCSAISRYAVDEEQGLFLLGLSVPFPEVCEEFFPFFFVGFAVEVAIDDWVDVHLEFAL